MSPGQSGQKPGASGGDIEKVKRRDMKKMRASRKVQLEMLESAYWRLQGCCESTHEWDRYLELHEREEKQHRGFKPDHVECGLTRKQSVRLFAVKEVFERFGMPNVCVCGWQGAGSVCGDCGKQANKQAIFTPAAEAYFHVRGSCFAAVAIAHLCRDRIMAEFTGLEMIEWLAKVDYVELNRDQRK